MLLRPLDKKIVTALYLFLSFVATILFSFSHGRRKTAFRRCDALKPRKPFVPYYEFSWSDSFDLFGTALRLVPRLADCFISAIELFRERATRLSIVLLSRTLASNKLLNIIEVSNAVHVTLMSSFFTLASELEAKFIRATQFCGYSFYKEYFHRKMSDKDRPESWAIDPTWCISQMR